MFFIPPAFVLKDYYDRRNMQYRSTTATVWDEDTLYGIKWVHDADKLACYDITVPENMKAGSDAQIVIHGCPMVTNDSGSAKGVRFRSFYNAARAGEVIPASDIPDEVTINIPNGEVAKTMHKEVVVVVSDLQAGDCFSCMLGRNALDELDTYAELFFTHLKPMFVYVADKIGVTV